ncbi:MAG: hypothetical protein AB8E15_04220 [Bdellovibrionales bacterium]
MQEKAYQELRGLECLNSAKEIRSKDLLDKVVLFFLFRDTETLSLIYLQKFKEWLQHYKDQFVVVGIYTPKFEYEKSKAYVNHSILRYEMGFPVFTDPEAVLKKIFGFKVEPGFVLYDTFGRRRTLGSGTIDLSILNENIVSLAKEGLKSKSLRVTNSIVLDSPQNRNSLLSYPQGICYSKTQKLFAITDTAQHRVLIFNENGIVQHKVGSGDSGDKDGNFSESELNHPIGLTEMDGVFYVADSFNHKVKAIDVSAQTCTTVVGTGYINFHQAVNHKATRVSLAFPKFLQKYKSEDSRTILITNTGSRQIINFDPVKEHVDSYIGNGRVKNVDDIYDYSSIIQPGFIFSKVPDFLFLLDSDMSNLKLANEGRIKTIVGKLDGEFGDNEGTSKEALLQHPESLAWDGGKNLLILDSFNLSIKKVDLTNMKLIRLPLDSTKIKYPIAIEYVSEDKYFIVDCFGHQIFEYQLSTGETQPLNLRFSGESNLSKSHEDKLPEPKNLKETLKKEYGNQGEVAVDLIFDIKSGFEIDPDSTSQILVYEKYVNNWFLVRTTDIEMVNLSPELRFKNIQGSKEYSVIVKLFLRRRGDSFGLEELNYQLEISITEGGSTSPIKWAIDASL